MNFFQSSKKRIWLLYIVVAAGLLFWLFPRREGTVKAEVRFLHHTNNPAGGRMVCLSVKNLGASPIASLNHAYIQNPLGAQARSVPLTQGFQYIALPPQQEELVFVPDPGTTNSWGIDLAYEWHQSDATRLIKALLREAGFHMSTIVYTVPGVVIEP